MGTVEDLTELARLMSTALLRQFRRGPNAVNSTNDACE